MAESVRDLQPRYVGSVDDRVLDVGLLEQRARHETVRLRTFDEPFRFAARQVGSDLKAHPREAQPLVVGLDAHLELSECDAALARRVRHCQGETGGERGQKQLGWSRTLVITTGGWWFVGQDVEVADADTGTVAALPASEEVLVSHDQRS